MRIPISPSRKLVSNELGYLSGRWGRGEGGGGETKFFVMANGFETRGTYNSATIDKKFFPTIVIYLPYLSFIRVFISPLNLVVLSCSNKTTDKTFVRYFLICITYTGISMSTFQYFCPEHACNLIFFDWNIRSFITSSVSGFKNIPARNKNDSIHIGTLPNVLTRSFHSIFPSLF